MFELPELMWELDCEPLGYPGLVVEMVLNPPIEEEIAEEAGRGVFYRQMARIIKQVRIPGAWTADGVELVLEMEDGEAVWALEHERGFDPQVLQWALRQYARRRQERLEIESKN